MVRIEARFATYVGIDLHTTSMMVHAIAAEGDGFERRGIPCRCTGTLLAFIASLPRPVCVGIESMGSFYWLWDLLKGRVAHRVLLDALDLSKLSPRIADTDRTVAAKIAHVLRDGRVPTCYVPPRHIRQLRQLGRQWQAVTEMMSTAKVQLRWLFHQNNFTGPGKINGASMQRWVAACGHKLEKLPLLLMSNWHQVVLPIERIRCELRREMMALVHGDPVLEHQVKLLSRARGIGEILSTIIVAEFGDFHRFGSADQVACWTGLTERSHVSNRQKYPGHISKAGSPTLRWALCEAAMELVRCDEFYQQMYERLCAKTGKPAIARTAMGRRVGRYCWKCIVSGQPFRTGPARPRTVRANEVRLRRHRRRQRRDAARERSLQETTPRQDA
jgi:hypothetical protein